MRTRQRHLQARHPTELVQATKVTTIEQITTMIAPHSGAIEHVATVTAGYGGSTTLLVEAERGRFFVKATPNQPGGNLEAARRESEVSPLVAELSPRVRFTVENREFFVIGFDAIEARASDFTPGSKDLPLVVDIVNRLSGTALPPGLVAEWEETRWDRFATDKEKALLKGNMLIHADIHEENLLIGEGRGWLVDWEWPTAGHGVIVPGCLAVQLVSAGHTPESAEEWVSRTVAWQRASRQSRAGFSRVNARMSRWLADLRGEEWMGELAKAAEAWAAHADT